MPAIGDEAEEVIGYKGTVAIGSGNTLELKELFRLSRRRGFDRDGVASGFHYSFHQLDGRFIVDVLASTPDMSTIDGYNDLNASGDLTEYTCDVNLTPIGGGAAVNAQFTAKFYDVSFGHITPEGKIKVHLEAVITSETITWS